MSYETASRSRRVGAQRTGPFGVLRAVCDTSSMRPIVLFLSLCAPLVASAATRSIAVRDLKAGEGVTEKTAATITEAVASELRRVAGLKVSTQQEIAATLSLEQQKQLLACSDDECMADFGGALGVSAMVTGNVGLVGASWLVNLKLIDVATVAVVAQSDRRLRGGTLDDVLDVLPAMSAELFGARDANPKPPDNAPVAPAAATPTLAERLPGTGRLINGAKKLCLDPKGFTGDRGTNVMLFACDGGKDQLWSVKDDRLANGMGKAVLDVAGKDAKPGANVQLGKVDTSQEQRWVYYDAGNGWFELHDAQGGLCLDVAGFDGKPRDNVMLWTCDRKPDQLWFWERVE